MYIGESLCPPISRSNKEQQPRSKKYRKSSSKSVERVCCFVNELAIGMFVACA